MVSFRVSFFFIILPVRLELRVGRNVDSFRRDFRGSTSLETKTTSITRRGETKGKTFSV